MACLALNWVVRKERNVGYFNDKLQSLVNLWDGINFLASFWTYSSPPLKGSSESQYLAYGLLSSQQGACSGRKVTFFYDRTRSLVSLWDNINFLASFWANCTLSFIGFPPQSHSIKLRDDFFLFNKTKTSFILYLDFLSLQRFMDKGALIFSIFR